MYICVCVYVSHESHQGAEEEGEEEGKSHWER